MYNNSWKHVIDFKNDIFIFRTYYEYEKGEPGDGYLQPDDNDKITIDKTVMVGYATEDKGDVILKDEADVTYVINEDVKRARDEAIENQIAHYRTYI
tara:strand:- start:263 stop:553 length:291 start_codon:yes stop_codon:yes gene_type:complete